MSNHEEVKPDLKATPTRELLRLFGEADFALKRVILSAPESAEKFRIRVGEITEEIVSRAGE